MRCLQREVAVTLLLFFRSLIDVTEHVLRLLPQLKRHENRIALTIPFLVDPVDPSPIPAVEQFKYSPTRKGAEIRLIKLDRNRSYPVILCTLIDVPLRAHIKYEAPSYTVRKFFSRLLVSTRIQAESFQCTCFLATQSLQGGSNSLRNLPIYLEFSALLISSTSVGRCFGRLKDHTHKPATIPSDTQPLLSATTSPSPHVFQI
jgi:hypothetical protein